MARRPGIGVLAVPAIAAVSLVFAPLAARADASSVVRAPVSGACERLAALALSSVRVTVAARIVPNPEWPFPPSAFNGFAALDADPAAHAVRKPFCRVAGVIEREIRFEVWMPDDWNGRLEGVGNGGLSGDLNYPAMGLALGGGYATASTDTGHASPAGLSDTSWIPGHRQRVIDFGHRGHHLTALAAKRLIAAYYGEPARHAYFNGCSAGGWQGLTEAQRHPEDYDGIIAGDPWIDFTGYVARGMWARRLSLLDPAGEIPDAKVRPLQTAAVDRCDLTDGIADGVIGDPERCDFDPGQIRCRGADADTCLTDPQVARARTLYGRSPVDGRAGSYPGYAYGAPPFASYPDYLTNRDMAITRAQEDGAMALMLARPPRWTSLTFDVGRDLPAVERELGPILNSDNPDLRRFRARGAKLILYHGWLDATVSPYVSVDYFRRAQAANGPDTAAFFRLFMIPGMGHCQGGPGADSFDKMEAITAWVERGAAPDRILAAHLIEGKVHRTRPLCAYPSVARYHAPGDASRAVAFTCEVP